MNPNSSTKSSRLVSLDILRFFAIMLVLGRHMGGDVSSLPGAPFWRALVRGGWVGVDLFFVLSGFLISGLLFDEYRAKSRINFGRFFVRRAFRIYPPFYFLLGFWILELSMVGQLSPALIQKIVHDALFIQNYSYGFLLHTWSLAVEEHFYLLLPWLFIGCYTFNTKAAKHAFDSLPYLIFLVAVATLLIRLTLVVFWPFRFLSHTYGTHLRLDSLLFGVLLAYLFRYRAGFHEMCRRYRVLLFCFGLLLLSPPFFLEINSLFHCSAGFTLYYLGSGLLLCAFVCSEAKHNSKWLGTMSYFGTFSYSVYLWHPTVRDLFLPLVTTQLNISTRPEIQLLLYLVGSFAVGILMNKLVEVPFLQLREIISGGTKVFKPAVP